MTHPFTEHPRDPARGSWKSGAAAYAFLVAVAVAMAGCGSADTAKPAAAILRPSTAARLPTGIEAQLDDRVSRYGRNWPAFRVHATVAVSRGPDAVVRAYGAADLFEDRPQAPTERIRIGTLGGRLTAATVVRLEQQGLLAMSDPIARFVPDVPGGDQITIEHLLTHTSGLPSFTVSPWFDGFKTTSPQPKEVVRRVVTQLPRDLREIASTPVGQFSPSATDFVLLGAAIEAASGRPYPQVVRNEILEPLGMKDTTYGDPSGPRAHGVSFHEDEYLLPADPVDPRALGAAGAWVTTAADWLAFERGLPVVLSHKGAAKMAGRNPMGRPYAGFDGTIAGQRLVSGVGLLDGHNAAVLVVPQAELAVVVLANSEIVSAAAVARDAAAIALGRPLPTHHEPRAVPLRPTEGNAYEGTYALTARSRRAVAVVAPEIAPQLARVSVSRRDADLWLQVPGHGRKWMHPVGHGRFFFKDRPKTTVRVWGAAGALSLRQGPLTLEYRRVRPDET